LSLRAILAVLELSEARLANRLVLIALADYAHDDGTNAFPSVPTIARKARVDERTVQRALRELEEAGDLEPTGKTRSGVTIWRLKPGGGNLSPEGLSNGSLTGSGGNLSPAGRQIATPEVTSRPKLWRCPSCPPDAEPFDDEDAFYDHVAHNHNEKEAA
jgi:hypothetical protein